MNKITVTTRGQELQNELRKSLVADILPKIQLEKQETPRRYRFLLDLQNDNVKQLQGYQSPKSERSKAQSLQTTRSCFYTEEKEQQSPNVREMRNRSLIQRIKSKERKIEHCVKLNISALQNSIDIPSFSKTKRGNSSTRALTNSSQLEIDQQKQNLLDNMERQQFRIYQKYVLTTKKQDLLQEKQKIKYKASQEEKGQLHIGDKARDKFWQNWKQLQTNLQQSTAQFGIEKDRELGRLEDFARQRYLKSFLKLPKCAKNYDKNYDEYKVL